MVDARLSSEEAQRLLRHELARMEPLGNLGSPGPQKPALRVRSQTFAPGEVVGLAPSRRETIGLVIQGEVAAYRSRHPDGGMLLVLTPGRTFGPSTALASQLADSTLKALIQCEIWFACAADASPAAVAGTSSSRMPPGWYRLGLRLCWLGVVLAALLILRLPATRSAFAVFPMAVGEWCGQQGRSGCAEEAWQVAAVLAAEDAGPRLALGTVYVRQGDLEAAEQAFRAAARLAPSLPEAAANLGVVLARRGDYEPATVAFRQALALDPGAVAVERNLAAGLLAQHDYDGALAHLHAALGLTRKQAAVLAELSIVYYAAGQLDDAEEAARQALGYDTTTAPAFAVLGALALEAQRPRDALTLLHRAVEIDNSNAAALFYLGVAYVALGQGAEAEAALKQTLAMTQDGALRDPAVRLLGNLHAEQENGKIP